MPAYVPLAGVRSGPEHCSAARAVHRCRATINPGQKHHRSPSLLGTGDGGLLEVSL